MQSNRGIGTGGAGDTLRDAVAVGAGRQAAHREIRRSAWRGEEAHQSRHGHARLQGHHQNPNTPSSTSAPRPSRRISHARDACGRQARASGKPIALELWEADELIALAKRGCLKFTIGYSQRFNTKFAFAKKKITDGTLGKVVSVMVSRHLSRSLGKKIASRVKLSPVVMESTHDLDFVFWLLEPAKPVRVYSQGSYGYMQPVNGSYDVMWTTVTMDNGVLVAIGGGWNLPPSYPNYCATWIEITGTEGSLFLDDTQRDNWLNTVSEGTRFPMSTMPGEQVTVFAGRGGRNDPLFGSASWTAGDGDAGKRAAGDGDLSGGGPVGRAQRTHRPAALQRDDVGDCRHDGEEQGVSRRGQVRQLPPKIIECETISCCSCQQWNYQI